MTRTEIKRHIREVMQDAGYGRGYSYEVLFNVPYDTDEGHGNYIPWADALAVAEPGDIMDVWVYQRYGPVGYQDTELVDNVVFRVGEWRRLGHMDGYTLHHVTEPGEPIAKQPPCPQCGGAMRDHSPHGACPVGEVREPGKDWGGRDLRPDDPNGKPGHVWVGVLVSAMQGRRRT